MKLGIIEISVAAAAAARPFIVYIQLMEMDNNRQGNLQTYDNFGQHRG